MDGRVLTPVTLVPVVLSQEDEPVSAMRSVDWKSTTPVATMGMVSVAAVMDSSILSPIVKIRSDFSAEEAARVAISVVV